jgi:heme exporter protein A
MNLFSGTGLTCMRGGRVVFAGLDFNVGSGRALLLVGPNGSGKSSLLRLMSGLARPVAGAIAWNGDAIDEEPEQHAARLHFVGHLDAVKPALTVAENLAAWVALRGAGGDAARALARFGLLSLADMPARLLSAGQRRRLALARIAAAPASLWLLDEPTVALDRPSVAVLDTAIADHLDAGGIVVLSSNVDVGLVDPVVLRIDDFTEVDDAMLDGVA